jgi:tetratricopeptide (TPR) repeat protein
MARRARGEILGYKVMHRVGDRLVSIAHREHGSPAVIGTEMRMPGAGVYLSTNRDFVLAHYSDPDAEYDGGPREEVLVTLGFHPVDVLSGSLTDREANLTVRRARILSIEPTKDRLKNPVYLFPSGELVRDESKLRPSRARALRQREKAGVVPFRSAEAARRLFERASEIDEDPDQWTTAEDLYQQSIHLDPTRGAAYSNLGILYDARLQPYEAIRLFEKALEVEPRADFALNAGITTWNNRRRQPEIIGKKKAKAPALRHTSRSQRYEGASEDLMKAQGLFERAIELDPDLEVAYIYLSKTLAEQDMRFQELALLKRYVRLFPEGEFAPTARAYIRKIERRVVTKGPPVRKQNPANLAITKATSRPPRAGMHHEVRYSFARGKASGSADIAIGTPSELERYVRENAGYPEVDAETLRSLATAGTPTDYVRDAFISWITVTPKRRGWGHRFLGQVLAHLSGEGVSRVLLHPVAEEPTREDFDRLVAFYRSLGFEVRYSEDDGSDEPFFIMVADL